MKYIGAIDQGTTSTRFMVFDHEGNEIARAQQEHDQILPRAGWVEHDPLQILERTLAVIRIALQPKPELASSIAAIGITNQRETTVVWNPKTGMPFCNAIVWQDMRTDNAVTRLQQEGLSEMIRQKTGLPISTYFSALKLRWILENVPDVAQAARNGDAIFGTIDSWLIWNLTGGPRNGAHITDVSNASRTMLMNLKTQEWDEELLAIFRIPRQMLPAIRPSSDSSFYGFIRDPFTIGVPLCGNAGDQQAALMGQACFEAGETKNTYGTGSFLLMHTGSEPRTSQHGLITTCAYKIKDGPAQFALEGSVAVTGSAVQWLRDQLGIIKNASQVEQLANSVPDNGGVYFVPAFSGLFAPYWKTDARGAIVGLSRFSNAGHLARATLEGICYQTRDVLEAMRKDSGIKLSTMKVDGGATVNNTLMQLQSNILGIPITRPVVTETTALGAAYAAGLAIGYWKDLSDLRGHWKVDQTWQPAWNEDQRETGYQGWKEAVNKTFPTPDRL
jgi:glycerol kinase